jgi:DNA-binding LacI/PurR family transcriptional regulator
LPSVRKSPGSRTKARLPAAGKATPRRRAPTGKLGGTATSHDVAALAGVSRSAVSRTFTPEASVSAKTRRKVLAAASRLGYQPNVIARSLITRQSRLIGLIMGEWENPFYTTMLRGFTERLGARDYRVMLLASRSPADVDAAMRMLMQYRVDGIVLVSASPGEAAANEYLRTGGRLVLINREPDRLAATGIACDNPRVGRELAERMLAAGYERFAMLRGDPMVKSGQQRAMSFRAGIENLGRGRIVIDHGGESGYAAGRAFGNAMMDLDTRPDAILCSTDIAAIGVLDGLRLDRRIDVPGEVGVVGFGDIPAASWASHELATVRLPIARMIDESVQVLLAGSPSTAGGTILVGADIVWRGSVRQPVGTR